MAREEAEVKREAGMTVGRTPIGRWVAASLFWGWALSRMPDKEKKSITLQFRPGNEVCLARSTIRKESENASIEKVGC